MENAWQQHWQQGNIGFHLPDTHPLLADFWPALGVALGAKVLVPLCGKSLDMRWLAKRGHSVLGIELVPEAIEQFLAQQPGSVARYTQAGFDVSRQGTLELWCGDFFHFHIQQAAEVEAFYDRAALIALPPATRERYVFHLAQLVPPGAKGLLIGFTHQEDIVGPPFSVPNSEIERLYTPNFRIELLTSRGPSPQGRCESVWALERRGPQN